MFACVCWSDAHNTFYDYVIIIVVIVIVIAMVHYEILKGCVDLLMALCQTLSYLPRKYPNASRKEGYLWVHSIKVDNNNNKQHRWCKDI